MSVKLYKVRTQLITFTKVQEWQVLNDLVVKSLLALMRDFLHARWKNLTTWCCPYCLRVICWCYTAGLKPPTEKQLLLVANAHMHWDPEYSDVKLIQTVMFLSELKSIAERALSSTGSTSASSDFSSFPIVLCADLNSLPDSGMIPKKLFILKAMH